jgi:two-component system response regulator YesN
MNSDKPLGGIFLGRSLPESFEPTTEKDMVKRLIGLKYNPDVLFTAAKELPLLSSKFIHDALEMLYIILYDTTALDPRVIRWKRHKTVQQARIGEVIHEQKLTGFSEIYPFESERELILKVRIGDKTGAREILNSILGSIMFRNPGQMDILKVRLVELLSILSRSASESGVAPEILLKKNVDYINKVISLENQDDICAWISLALNDFLDNVYELHQAHKHTRLKPAMEYIQRHYNDTVTLEDIAKAAHLSVSRLCHLFKEQLNTTAFKYLNTIRIQHAKYLLISTDLTCIEVCFDSGFTNLSYFNRTFKQNVGITPTEFRKQNRR